MKTDSPNSVYNSRQIVYAMKKKTIQMLNLNISGNGPEIQTWLKILNVETPVINLLHFSV